MFYGEFMEKDKKEIEVNEVHYEDFVVLLQMIYPSDRKITDENVVQLLHLADNFQMTMVLNKIEQFLMSADCELGVPTRFKLSDKYRLCLFRTIAWTASIPSRA
ncbi:hypothetical protein PFISCL1PPCAC_21231 [Pristionchus fissidentatus]|uniref:BTB domain-containing protein n=1 Tax=Pristionchus fissidentatus TaxID=1538716 RepID=A0AAV5WJG7_9BILA|nr:hypothetical protein PFISCL1PPCAC_21231 [Pristionchus fissidentatus]